jgi:hypothetical protein
MRFNMTFGATKFDRDVATREGGTALSMPACWPARWNVHRQ